MTLDASALSVQDRFQHLLAVISSNAFLEMKGLGNEVPFFICPFPPRDAVEMLRAEKQIVNRLAIQGISVLEVDLYDVCIALLKKRGIWDRVLEMEESVAKDQFKELLQSVLDPETHLIPAITERMRENAFDVLFIIGVGEVFPYIRSHTVLNNLQSKVKDRPTVMFFPGEYIQSPEHGASLNLFGLPHDDKYYRAFNIFHVPAPWAAARAET